MKTVKHIEKSRVSFKYYLNRDLKPDNKGAYPIYISIVFQGKNTEIKSRLPIRLKSEADLTAYKAEVSKEVESIYQTINNRWKYNNFTLNGISQKDIIKLKEKRQKIESELNALKKQRREINRMVYKESIELQMNEKKMKTFLNDGDSIHSILPTAAYNPNQTSLFE